MPNKNEESYKDSRAQQHPKERAKNPNDTIDVGTKVKEWQGSLNLEIMHEYPFMGLEPINMEISPSSRPTTKEDNDPFDY